MTLDGDPTAAPPADQGPLNPDSPVFSCQPPPPGLPRMVCRMLDLMDGRRSLSSICQLSGIPLSTALAVTQKLLDQGLVRVGSPARHPHRADASRTRKRGRSFGRLVLAVALAVLLHLALVLMIMWVATCGSRREAATRLLNLDLVSSPVHAPGPPDRIRPATPHPRRRSPSRIGGGAAHRRRPRPGIATSGAGRGLTQGGVRPAPAVDRPQIRRQQDTASRPSAAPDRPSNPGEAETAPVPTPIFDLPESSLSSIQRVVLDEVQKRRDKRLRALALKRQRYRDGLALWMMQGTRQAPVRAGRGRGQGARAGRGGGQGSPLFGVSFSVSARRVKDSPVTRRPQLLRMPPVRCGTPSRDLRTAVIKSLVDRRGKVMPHRFIQRSGDEQFDACARTYVRGMRFRPGADVLGRKLNVWIYVKVEPGTLIARPTVASR